MVKSQLKRARDSVNIREVVERLITAFSERNTRYGVGSLVSVLHESTLKLSSGVATMNRDMYTGRFVLGSTAAAKAWRLYRSNGITNCSL